MNVRFYSLDVFRGATVAFMILVNNPGNWDFIYSPLEHAPWNGITPTDLVFPFFLFAVGNALAFVLPRMEKEGSSAFLKKVFLRSLVIFAIGLFLNWFPFFSWQNGHLLFKHWVNPDKPEYGIRILGVLQRIALCYCFASLVLWYFKIRGAFFTAAILLLVYWVLCLGFGTTGDPYSINGYFGTALDKTILGTAHLYRGEGVAFDPEGLASTIPSVAEVIFGYLVGNYIIQKGKNYEMVTKLFVTGCLLIFLGYCWNMFFPINKKIWTSSFTIYTTGLAIVVLCILMDLIEFREQKSRWTKFFNVFGKNALFIFVLSGFIPRILGLIQWTDGKDGQGLPILTSPLPWYYEHVCKPISGNLKNGSLLFAIITVLLYWTFAYWLDKKKIYIRV
jgi:predicted acyltransferase